MERRWVSSREAAEELGISLRTLQDLLVRGLIVGARRLGTGPRSPWIVPSPVIRIRADRGPQRRPGTPRHMLKDGPSLSSGSGLTGVRAPARGHRATC